MILDGKLKCDRCKKEIFQPTYMKIIGNIMPKECINTVDFPNIFKCEEQLENYRQTLTLHDDCWMELLKEHGIFLHNMTDVLKKYQALHDKAKEE